MLGSCIGSFGAIPCCVVCPNPYKPVSQGNVGLVTKFGRFYRAVDPGLVKINPLSEKLIQVDVKIQIVGMFHSHSTPSSPSLVQQLNLIPYRGPKASLHDQRQCNLAPHLRNLLPHHIPAQSRLWHLQHPPSPRRTHTNHS